MRFRVVAFASAADALGTGEMSVELTGEVSGAVPTVADLKEHLESRFPKLARHWPRLAIAIDGELARSDAPLAEGVEVALLPPVSGGSGAVVTETSVPKAALSREPLDTETIADLVRDPACGAVLVFLGTVRNRHDGREVSRLTYTAYEPMAETRLRRIVEELESESGSGKLRAAIHHRLGEVPAGEPSVAIAISSPHRAEAYEASRTALERLKAEVPIWKREHYADGEARWREEEGLTEAASQSKPSSDST